MSWWLPVLHSASLWGSLLKKHTPQIKDINTNLARVKPHIIPILFLTHPVSLQAGKILPVGAASQVVATPTPNSHRFWGLLSAPPGCWGPFSPPPSS